MLLRAAIVASIFFRLLRGGRCSDCLPFVRFPIINLTFYYRSTTPGNQEEVLRSREFGGFGEGGPIDTWRPVWRPGAVAPRTVRLIPRPGMVRRVAFYTGLVGAPCRGWLSCYTSALSPAVSKLHDLFGGLFANVSRISILS